MPKADNRTVRDWKLLPEPGFTTIDFEDVQEACLELAVIGWRMGFSFACGPVRVKREDGTFYTGGWLFRAYNAPAIPEEEWMQRLGLVAAEPEFDEFDDLGAPGLEEFEAAVEIGTAMDGDNGAGA